MILILICLYNLVLFAETEVIDIIFIRSAYKVLHNYNTLLYIHTFKYKLHTFKSYRTPTQHTTLTLIKLFFKSHVLRLDTTYMHLIVNYG